jgi:hypothetical protein
LRCAWSEPMKVLAPGAKASRQLGWCSVIPLENRPGLTLPEGWSTQLALPSL